MSFPSLKDQQPPLMYSVYVHVCACVMKNSWASLLSEQAEDTRVVFYILHICL